jgi:two-component system, cell cycle sensor histidine kinase and response regulator CckA
MPNQAVLLTVTDSGTGMDARTVARAFEPFFTTKALGEGSGLGLATVYGIVEQSGGLIGIESSVGHGTSVHIAFPYSERGPEEMATKYHEQHPRASHGVVLLVEDDDGVRAVVRRVLKGDGYEIVEGACVADGIAAWERSRAEGRPIHLLVSDMVMPGGTGRELAAAIRAQEPLFPVLFMSGYTEGGMTDADDAISTSYLEKPFTTPHLLQEVRRLLALSRDD